MVWTVIFAGGTGTRMHSEDVPKQFLTVDGKPIIVQTLQHFSKSQNVDSIIVVCLESWIETLKKYIEEYSITKITRIIPGGNTGFQSIHKGLQQIEKLAKNDDIVLLCDGVRPILSQELIDKCIDETQKFGSAVPVTPSIDSVLVSEDGEHCSERMERKKIYITQAPQGYIVRNIMDAHKAATEKGIESVSSADLMIELGKPVHIFEGLRENIKVTTKEDLNSLRAIKYYKHFRNFAEEELK